MPPASYATFPSLAMAAGEQQQLECLGMIGNDRYRPHGRPPQTSTMQPPQACRGRDYSAALVQNALSLSGESPGTQTQTLTCSDQEQVQPMRAA
jgi:hypothetical protein